MSCRYRSNNVAYSHGHILTHRVRENISARIPTKDRGHNYRSISFIFIRLFIHGLKFFYLVDLVHRVLGV